MNIIQKPTDHCEDRKGGARPNMLIMHYTETQNGQDAEDYFLGTREHPTGGRVSTHYMIDMDGTVTQYVDEDKRAWHAGVSYWDSETDINSCSIGVELVNPGRKYGYRAFPLQQMDALVTLAKDIIKRHHIHPYRVLGHSDVAPDRKKDPGELFDWQMIAGAGIGLWPDPGEKDYKVADDLVRDPDSLHEALTRAGYNPEAKLETVNKAFQRHFYPKAFKSQEEPGVMDRECAARLNWLIRQKPTL